MPQDFRESILIGYEGKATDPSVAFLYCEAVNPGSVEKQHRGRGFFG
jgi:hypothetical protein